MAHSWQAPRGKANKQKQNIILTHLKALVIKCREIFECIGEGIGVGSAVPGAVEDVKQEHKAWEDKVAPRGTGVPQQMSLGAIWESTRVGTL